MTNSRSEADCPFQPNRPTRPSFNTLALPWISGKLSNRRFSASRTARSGMPSISPIPKRAGVFLCECFRANSSSRVWIATYPPIASRRVLSGPSVA